MKLSIAHSRAPANAVRAALMLAAAALLSGCQTVGSGPSAEAAPPEPPMTHAHAAELCWMATEKGHASANIDKRADIVTKCIDDKMKAAPKS